MSSNPVRIGVIGLGNIGQHHAAYLADAKVARAQLVAVATSSPAKAANLKNVRTFATGEELIQSGLVDAIVIATPHYQHTSLGIAALRCGLHIMVEKPISAHKADAERLIAVHRENPGLVFAGMFPLRVEPRYLQIRKLIQSGELGQIVRLSWIMTDWFRTEAYYASSQWRATWKGEGGGVLLNQCLHNLDVLQWLLGMPATVRGFCQFGRFHHIEVEDNVTAYLEYPNGATGTFISSTGEAPGTNRFELAGTRGKLVLEDNKLLFTRNHADMLEFSQTSTSGFTKPDATQSEIPFDNATTPHAQLMQNFVNAILDGEPLLAPGPEGIHSVELANVILFSSLLNQTITLPMDGLAYEQKLNDLIANSRIEKKVVAVSTDDFTASFRR